MATKIALPLEEPPNLYDNSTISSARTCLRFVYLRYQRHWTLDNVQMPLHFGSCWHDSMDYIWQEYHDHPDDDSRVDSAFEKGFLARWTETMPHPDNMDLAALTNLKARTPYNAKEMLYGYVDSRKHILKEAEIIAVEQPFLVSLQGYSFIGRLDKVINFKGQQIIVEHKTTSEYSIEHGFKSDFVDSFNPNSQLDGYMYAGRQYYNNIDYIWVDAALVHKSERRFKMLPFARPFENGVQWEAETIYWIRLIEIEKEALESAHKDAPIMTAFPRNTSACVGKYGKCMFRDICMACLNPAQIKDPPPGYKYEKWEPYKTFGLKEE